MRVARLGVQYLCPDGAEPLNGPGSAPAHLRQPPAIDAADATCRMCCCSDHCVYQKSLRISKQLSHCNDSLNPCFALVITMQIACRQHLAAKSMKKAFRTGLTDSPRHPACQKLTKSATSSQEPVVLGQALPPGAHPMDSGILTATTRPRAVQLAPADNSMSTMALRADASTIVPRNSNSTPSGVGAR